jgi:hypothetical protein
MLSTLKIGLVFVAVAGLAGCATSVDAYTTPDGRAGFVVDCSGNGMVDCHAKAREACNGGNYEVVDRIDQAYTHLGNARFDQRLFVACST